MRQVIKYTAIVLATLLVLLILWQFRVALLFFVASLLVAATIRPIVDWLSSRGLSRGMAPMLLYGAGIAVLLVVALLLGDRLVAEINDAMNRAVVEYAMLYKAWDTDTAWQQTVVGLLPQPFVGAETETLQVEQLLPAVVNVGRGIAGLLAGLLALLALSIYWSADQYRFERLWLSILPPQRRAYALNTWRAVEKAMGSYLRSQIVQSLLAAVFIGLGAAIAGLQFPLLLAGFAALAAFVPFVGGFLTAVAVFAVGALESRWLGAGMALYALLVFLGLDLFVEPRLWDTRRRGFLLTVILIVPLYESFGLLGLILATPVAAVLEVLIWQAYEVAVLGRRSAVRLDELQTRYHALSEQLAGGEPDDLTPELKSISERLAKLLAASQSAGIPKL